MRRVLAFVAIALALGLLIVGPTVTLVVMHRQDLSECRNTQHNYDAQIFVIRFIGHELKASDARIDAALERFRIEQGDRPKC